MNSNHSELIRSLIEAINNYTNKPFDWPGFMISIAPSIVAIISMIVTVKITQRTLNMNGRTREKEKLELQLETFYYPFLVLLQKNEGLYGIFKSERDDFRTLIKLLEGSTFDGNDGEILNEIVKIDNELNKLILQESKFADDDSLRKGLSKASNHFEIISLAHQKKLKGDTSRFEGYTYPKELDGMVIQKIADIKTRITELNGMVNSGSGN